RGSAERAAVYLYILMLVNRSTLRTATPGRLILGAALGGGAYPALFLVGGPIGFKLLLGGAGALGMLLITFPVRGFRPFLRLLEKMLFFSFCLGGGLLFLIRSLRFPEGILNGVFGILGLGGILFLFLERALRKRGSADPVCRATLRYGEEEVTVSALIDSGNSLAEPISGRPVSVVEAEILRGLWGEAMPGCRVIPYHSIGKKRGILTGCLLPELLLEVDGMRKKFRNVYVAASPEKISVSGDGGADSVKMIINPRLLQEEKQGESEKGQIERMYDSENSATGKDAV
ncbi:MAG: sigma-E processing peptidase SpoIIGA, partial [Roseburia sp.]|nr:sigma-E processing peptidase SpoIIGA [Roseburia sp.]